MIRFLFFLSVVVFLPVNARARPPRRDDRPVRPMAFRHGPRRRRAAGQWYNQTLADKINLPGILQAQGYGDEISINTPWVAALPRDMRWYLLPQYKAYTQPGNVKMPYLSQPPRHYLGVAWYQRDIDIPTQSEGRRFVLTLERTRWQSTVWIDDRKIGSYRSFVAPHIF